MLRSAILAARPAFLLAAFLLGACEDHSADIQAVQSTPMREVADNGAKKMAHQRMAVADYLQQQFERSNPKFAWSSEELASEEGAAERVGVVATIRPGERWFPKKIVVHFGYEPATRKVAFLGAEIDGKPAQSPSGGTLKMAGLFKATLLAMLARGEAAIDAIGGDTSTDPEITEFRRDLRQPD